MPRDASREHVSLHAMIQVSLCRLPDELADCDRLELIDEFITAREIGQTFVLSRMLVVDEHTLKGACTACEPAPLATR